MQPSPLLLRDAKGGLASQQQRQPVARIVEVGWPCCPQQISVVHLSDGRVQRSHIGTTLRTGSCVSWIAILLLVGAMAALIGYFALRTTVDPAPPLTGGSLVVPVAVEPAPAVPKPPAAAAAAATPPTVVPPTIPDPIVAAAVPTVPAPVALPTVRATDRLNVPAHESDAYTFRVGALPYTRNLTDLELATMSVQGVALAHVFRRMDALLRAHRAPGASLACIAHPQVVLKGRNCAGCPGARAPGGVPYPTEGLNLVSVDLGNFSEPRILHMVNNRPFGARERPMRVDTQSMRWNDRKRNLVYPESGWFRYVDADTEGHGESIVCTPGSGEKSCGIATSKIFLRNTRSFCVHLADDEMGGDDPFLR